VPDPAAAPEASGTQALLDSLLVEAEPPRVGYDRDLFDHWSDLDGDRCNTRYEVLVAESLEPVETSDGCRPTVAYGFRPSTEQQQRTRSRSISTTLSRLQKHGIPAQTAGVRLNEKRLQMTKRHR
jgi:hypothetical protein